MFTAKQLRNMKRRIEGLTERLNRIRKESPHVKTKHLEAKIKQLEKLVADG
jgi:hypothetical protein